MDVIIPKSYDNVISTIVEPGPGEGSIWSASTTYKKGDVCYKNHYVYTSRSDSNINNDPEKSNTGLDSKWILKGPTNMWAMLDNKVYTVSTATSEELVISMDFNRCTGFAIFNMDASELNVSVTDIDSDVPYFNRDYDLLVDRRSRWRYRYEESKFIKNVNDTTIGISPKAKITFTFRKPPAQEGDIVTINVGMIVIGRAYILGRSEYGIAQSSRNFSKVVENEFGNTDINPGLSTKKIRGTFFIDPSETDQVLDILGQVEKMRAAWICDNSSFGHKKYECLTTYGYLSTFDGAIENYGQTRIPFEILGLI